MDVCGEANYSVKEWFVVPGNLEEVRVHPVGPVTLHGVVMKCDMIIEMVEVELDVLR